MENTLLDSKTLSTITLISETTPFIGNGNFKTSCLRLSAKNQKRHRLLSFAGILTETEAEDLLNVIQQNRYNKNFLQEV